MTTTYPTSGELERRLAQRIQALYRRLCGHQPNRVICHLFANTLAIIAENVITPVERILDNEDREGSTWIPQLVRSRLDSAIKPQLKSLIEEVLQVSAIELLSETNLESGYTGVLVILTETPQVRNPNAIPKNRRRQSLTSGE